jgi:hypothetical protein
VSTCPAAGHPFCRRLPWLAQTQKQNQRQNRGVTAHKTLKLVLLSNSYTFLPCKQRPSATNRWNSQKNEGAIAWRNKNLLVVELCGVMGRLHPMEGLAQSNNNAKLNYSAKHDQKLLEVGAKVEESEGTTVEEGFGRRKKAALDVLLLFLSLSFFHFLLLPFFTWQLRTEGDHTRGVAGNHRATWDMVVFLLSFVLLSVFSGRTKPPIARRDKAQVATRGGATA